MDPNKNLFEQLRIAKDILKDTDESNEVIETNWEDARALAEYVVALHDWLHSGGELPYRWSPQGQQR